jgi:hypothetical protein
VRTAPVPQPVTEAVFHPRLRAAAPLAPLSAKLCCHSILVPTATTTDSLPSEQAPFSTQQTEIFFWQISPCRFLGFLEQVMRLATFGVAHKIIGSILDHSQIVQLEGLSTGIWIPGTLEVAYKTKRSPLTDIALFLIVIFQ